MARPILRPAKEPPLPKIQHPGTSPTVSLSSGELAVVVESNPNPDFIHQPKVRIVTDIHQKSAPPSLIDLAHPSQSERHILHCVNPEKYAINSAHYVC